MALTPDLKDDLILIATLDFFYPVARQHVVWKHYALTPEPSDATAETLLVRELSDCRAPVKAKLPKDHKVAQEVKLGSVVTLPLSAEEVKRLLGLLHRRLRDRSLMLGG